jgi:hypothetical protein
MVSVYVISTACQEFGLRMDGRAYSYGVTQRMCVVSS